MNTAKVVKVEAVPAQRNENGFDIRWLLKEQVGDKDISVAYTVIPPGGSSGTHVRESAEEILFYLQGHATVEIEGGETFTMEPNTMIVIPPGVRHNHRNAGAEPVVQFFVQTQTV